jgi:hypothetical protein
MIRCIYCNKKKFNMTSECSNLRCPKKTNTNAKWGNPNTRRRGFI